MAVDIENIVGIANRSDGLSDGPLRLSRQGGLVVAEGHGRYYEPTARGIVYTLTLAATTTGVAAGNIVAAAAAASTQFGLINPVNSLVNLVLLKFGMGVISGTPGAGPIFHGYIPSVSTISAASAGGTIRSNKLSLTASSQATPWSLAAGSAITGGQAPVVFRPADFTATATAQAVANGHVRCIEEIAGEIIVPPGAMWLPLWSAAGSSLLNTYSITWEEVSV